MSGGGPLREGGRQVQVEVTAMLGGSLQGAQHVPETEKPLDLELKSEGLRGLTLYAEEREPGFIPRAWQALEGFYEGKDMIIFKITWLLCG